MGVLTNLEPASVFHYFEEICSIPHTSHHEKALSDYCVQFAKAHGLACRQDEMGNVLIKAPATPGYENQPALILQGHLDMVGDKTAACPLDLEKDAIQLVVLGTGEEKYENMFRPRALHWAATTALPWPTHWLCWTQRTSPTLRWRSC